MPTPKETWDLAGALLDGEPVDWSRFEREGSSDRGRLIASLRSLAPLAGGGMSRPTGQSAGFRGSRRLPPWVLVVPGIAAIHLVIAGAGFVAGAAGRSPVPPAGSALVAVVFAAAAVWLFAGGRGDLRASSLGVFYLLVAAAFARRFVGIASDTPIEAVVTGVFPDAFLPAFLWSFVSRFPRVLRFSGADRFCRAAFAVSAGAGMVLFVANVVLRYAARAPASHVLHRAHGSGLYWAIVLALCAAALPAIVIRARRAPADERRRVTFFCGAVLLTIAPILLEIFAEILLPAFSDSMDRPAVRQLASYAVFTVLLALPFATAYAVVVDRMLDVRLVVGRALQHLLARSTLVLVSAAPFALLAAFGARNRGLTLGELLSGRAGVVALSLMVVGLLLLLARQRLLAGVDRFFMRTAIDLAGELARLTGTLGNARSAEEAFELVEDAIERATGAETVRVYRLADAQGFTPSRGVGEPLPDDAASVVLLREDPSPLAVGDSESASLSRLLPPADARWVDRNGCAVLVPLVRAGESLSGFISLGRKRNGLPFAPGELTFLQGVASAAALAISDDDEREARAAPPEDLPARECIVCGGIAAAAVCGCGGATRVAALPPLLHAKFRVERRVGAGGMGVVYRAVDAALDRPVALKTLSRLSASAAARLAREAKVMAAVVHPHLATIYGVERWRGTPVLVVEYCEHGTLADRLESGPMGTTDALRLGLDLTRALDALHAAGVLHRDVKPSNIGFLANGAGKLLDFGIASFAATPVAHATSDEAEGISGQTQSVETRGRTIVGTPLYLAPEAVRGGEPDARVDLWALALVMYEAVAGYHPFAAATVSQVLARVRRGRIPDLRARRPDCPDDLAGAFRRWLARDPAARPATAGALADHIERLLEDRR